MGEGSARATAARFLPAERTLSALASAARVCRGCSLYRDATQTVFGEGAGEARLMLVGEMPGDEEDRAGSPFVGPAGRILDEALAQAHIARSDAYVTNVVKHFKWEPRGPRRLHKTPSAREIGACLPWLQAEIEVVGPEVLVCLGATAARALLGSDYRVSQQHGQFVASDLAPHVTATGHPSAVLRMPDAQRRARAMRQLVEDLKKVARVLNGESGASG
ncbi:MAG: UdgX family uracil-DNA binding protein [Gammaproteobacteria bacterium]|jgi:DNA polymerase